MNTLTHDTDSHLRTAVTDELSWTPDVDDARIGVAVSKGTVTLTGDVDSFPQKRNAERAAQRVRGVTAIADEITVRDAWSDRDDADIAREAGEALERSVDVPTTVKASVQEHVVTLTGEVPWQFQRAAAARAVRYLRGVTDVLNVIMVTPHVSTGDIYAGIRAALVRNALIDARHVTVAADSVGTVTLTGVVGSWFDRNQAAHAAWSAPGVTHVINHLTIR